METTPAPQGPPQFQALQPKTSGMAIASLVCGILGICLALPAPVGLILGIMAIRQINSSAGTIGGKGLAIGGLVTSCVGMIACLGILASLLLPTLGKATNKANRVKCANNLSQLNKAFIDFADELDGQSPHLFGGFSGPDGNKWAQAIGYSSVDDPYDTTRWMSAYGMRQSLATPRSLVSPSDPAAMAAMRRSGVEDFSQFSNKPVQVDPRKQSYAIAMQGDLFAPETVLAMTRNLKNASDAQRRDWYQAKGGRNSGDIWMYPNGDRPWSKHIGAAHIQDGGMSGYAAEFHGEDGDEDPKHSMTGLAANQANWGTAGGAVAQGSASEFNDQLMRAKDNYKDGNAVAPGLNLTVLRPQQ